MTEYKENEDDYLDDGFPKDFDAKKYKLQAEDGGEQQSGAGDYVIEQIMTIVRKRKHLPVYDCIGQMLMQYDGDEGLTGGSGSVFKKLPNNYYAVLTAAHNVLRFTKVSKTKEDPIQVWFLPRGSGDSKCRLQFVDKMIYDEYNPGNDLNSDDLAVVLFHDKKGKNGLGTAHFDHIAVNDVIEIAEWPTEEDPTVNVFGYPIKSDGLLQGQSGEAELKQNRGIWVYDDIYTYPGTSGAPIFKKIRKEKKYGIYGVHTFGNPRKQDNCGVFLDSPKRKWIKQIVAKYEAIASANAEKAVSPLNGREVPVEKWLKETVGLKEKVIAILVENEYDDMEAIELLTVEKLKEMGVKMGSRDKIMKYVEKLKEKRLKDECHDEKKDDDVAFNTCTNPIITIAVGQCGIRLCNAFYDSIFMEYNLDGNGRQRNDRGYVESIYLEQHKQGIYRPNACLFDLDPGIMNIIKASSMGAVYDANSMCFGDCGVGNHWEKGHYLEGAELIDECVDIIRRRIETSDSPQVFQMMHSIGGGTGAGMGTLLMLKLADYYPHLNTTAFTVFPSAKVSEVMVEPYNAVLSLNVMDENCNGVFVIDNEALFDILTSIFKVKEPEYKDLNEITKVMMNDVTSIFRYPDSYGFDLPKFTKAMIQHPQLKYLTTARAPFYDYNKKTVLKTDTNTDLNCLNLTQKLFEVNRSYSKCDISTGINLATTVLYRGYKNVNSRREIMQNIKKRISVKFKKDVITTSIDPYKSLLYTDKIAAMIANTTAIKTPLERIGLRFYKMYKRKAFLYRYEVMDAMEFEDAYETLTTIIEKYYSIE